MRRPVPDRELDLLAARLGAAGVDRRGFLRIAAGLAAMGAAGFNARPASSAPKLAPGEKLAKEQTFRYGGGGFAFSQVDPSSHDFNKDLYCNGVPSLLAGLMKFNADFQAVPYVASKVTSNSRRVRVDLHDPEGLEVVRRQPLHRPRLRVLLEAPARSGHEGALRRVPVRHQERRGVQQGPGHRRRAGRRQGQRRLDARGHARGTPRLLSGPDRVRWQRSRGTRRRSRSTATSGPSRGTSSPTARSSSRRGSTASSMVLKKNPHFFGAKEVTLEKVVIPIIPFAAGVLPYENNEIDLTILQAADLKRFRDNPKTAQRGIPLPVSRGRGTSRPRSRSRPSTTCRSGRRWPTRWTGSPSPRSPRASPCPPTA